MFSFLPEALKLKITKAIGSRYAIILVYHSVTDYPLEFDIWTHMSADLFEEHMKIIASEANVIPLEELLSQVVSGKVGKNLVSVTFDDGFRNNYTTAYPILKKYDISATIFLTTSYVGSGKLLWPERISYQLMKSHKSEVRVGRLGLLTIKKPDDKQVAYRKIINYLKYLPANEIEKIVVDIEDQLGATYDVTDPLYQAFVPLSWEDVRLMEQEGLISFGGHSASHAILSRLTLDAAYEEIRLCREALDMHLSKRTRIWAYPNGTKEDFDSPHKGILRELGFDLGILTAEPEYVSSGSDVTELGRFGIGNKMSPQALRALLSKRGRMDRYNGLKKIVVALRESVSAAISNLNMR